MKVAPPPARIGPTQHNPQGYGQPAMDVPNFDSSNGPATLLQNSPKIRVFIALFTHLTPISAPLTDLIVGFNQVVLSCSPASGSKN